MYWCFDFGFVFSAEDGARTCTGWTDAMPLSSRSSLPYVPGNMVSLSCPGWPWTYSSSGRLWNLNLWFSCLNFQSKWNYRSFTTRSGRFLGFYFFVIGFLVVCFCYCCFVFVSWISFSSKEFQKKYRLCTHPSRVTDTYTDSSIHQ